jgi:RHH-type proline utilization regulon transcriptional repressor/proline dehydrogenase/delta 1-pyrroline-5-carboxylate dehydrogenase
VRAAQGAWTASENPATLARCLAAAAEEPTLEHPSQDLPGPTGESNRLSLHPRVPLLCLGPGREAAEAQAQAVRAQGGRAVEAQGSVLPEALATLAPLGGAVWWGDEATARAYEDALARRKGAILPLILGAPIPETVLHERHVCIDTTAAGGNATLLAGTATGSGM